MLPLVVFYYLVFHRDLLRRTSLKLPILCQVGCKALSQSFSQPASDCLVVIFADAMAVCQSEESSKEKVVPELRSSSLGDLSSMLTHFCFTTDIQYNEG